MRTLVTIECAVTWGFRLTGRASTSPMSMPESRLGVHSGRLPAPVLVALVSLAAFAVYAWPVAHSLLRHRAVFIPVTSDDTIPTSLLPGQSGPRR